jgi:hypothetical protein
MRGQAVCPKCSKLVWIREDGELRVHGPRNGRCPGRRSLESRFKVGDRCVPYDDLTSEHGVVEGVEHHYVGGEWREYIGYRLRNGHGGGNADLYLRVSPPIGGERP